MATCQDVLLSMRRKVTVGLSIHRYLGCETNLLDGRVRGSTHAAIDSEKEHARRRH